MVHMAKGHISDRDFESANEKLVFFLGARMHHACSRDRGKGI